MKRPLLLDGGTGSELRRRGVPFIESCWSASANLTDADILTSIHQDFIQAGADLITTNTFATSRFVLAAGGLADRFTDINAAALDAARRAVRQSGKAVRIGASLSCCPPFLEHAALPDAATARRDYRQLAQLFAASGVDLILLEMLQDPGHAALACEAAAESGLPFWAGLSCRQAAGPGSCLVAFDQAETTLRDVLAAVLEFEPAGIAVMHSPVDAIQPALAAVRTHWDGPLGAYAEVPYDADPGVTTDRRITPAAYADYARGWLDFELALLGGCCGTTPAHIAKLRALLESG